MKSSLDAAFCSLSGARDSEYEIKLTAKLSEIAL